MASFYGEAAKRADAKIHPTGGDTTVIRRIQSTVEEKDYEAYKKWLQNHVEVELQSQYTDNQQEDGRPLVLSVRSIEMKVNGQHVFVTDIAFANKDDYTLFGANYLTKIRDEIVGRFPDVKAAIGLSFGPAFGDPTESESTFKANFPKLLTPEQEEKASHVASFERVQRSISLQAAR